MAKKPISPALRAYLLENQTKLEEDAKVEVGEANETNRTLLNQLFVMAGGIITLSSPIFIKYSVLHKISPDSRRLLVIAISAAAVSIASGFVQLHVERRFFRKSKNRKLGLAKKIGLGEVRSVSKLRTLLGAIKAKSSDSPDFFTWLQFISLGVGAIAFVTVMSHILLTA